MQHERLENFELRCKVLSNAPDMEDCREFHELVSEIGVRGLEEFQIEKQQLQMLAVKRHETRTKGRK